MNTSIFLRRQSGRAHIPTWFFVCILFSNEVRSALLPNYALLVNLVTALVPSETACLASSPGSTNRTAVWISRDVIVGFLL